MKKYLAELAGTMVLVLLGCGAAVSLGCDNGAPATVVGTAMTFGLAVVAMAYTIGGISGCHINPAINYVIYQASVVRWLLAFGKLLNLKIRSNAKSTK